MTEVLKVLNLNKHFSTHRREVKAVDNVSFTLHEGEILALAGESGSGKSTCARIAAGILPADSGSITVCGRTLSRMNKSEQRFLHQHIQMIFQNAEGSFNPRMKIGDAILETIRNFKTAGSRKEAFEKMHDYFAMTGLPDSIAGRYPGQISGGQCQRAAIVRALTAEPEILICDEATSALDVLVQAHIMELLHKLQRDRGMSMLFISHDLALISSISDYIMIMKQGRVVEEGKTDRIIHRPEQPYTRLLLDSIL